MEDFEKLGVFYLGRVYDLKTNKSGGLLLYDSRDLVTHAVIVGMTGSGKTGLGIDLIEEAAIDGVPSIVIDPKGDLADLLLTFPALEGIDFLPWINLDDARQQGLSPERYAEQQAATWKKGLADWGQSPERIQRLRQAADFLVYTPGSTAGLPVSILKSFAAPEQAVIEDSDLMRERISTTVTSLLGLVGIEADPVQSREHILLSTILDRAWRQGQALDLAAIIQQVQSPPVSKVGVLDLESFYPSKERFALVMALNNLLASPGFEVWLQGQPLDIGQILYTPEGKPRVAIFSIAHLGDPERMFFVSLLLNQVLGWMRTQAGTTSLRAMVYLDEVFGYMPPLSNPPSKLPLLTLLKQGRAFGLGMVLATQNPVDLDYKGLSNAGTWFIGRLQTERDKARLLDGLEGVTASTGVGFQRQELDRILSGLGKRVFLLNNVGNNAPVTFQTRWALSYLSGPLTRDQIKRLMEGRKAAVPAVGPGPAPSAAPVQAAPAITSLSATAGSPPPVPPGVPSYYCPIRGRAPKNSSLVYLPRILGAARVRIADLKVKVDVSRDVTLLAPVTDQAIPLSWDEAQEVELTVSDLDKSPEAGAQYGPLPAAAGQAKNYAAWSRALATWIYGNQALELFKSPSLGQVSQPGESERDFRLRLQQAAREQRDEAAEKLRRQYAPKIAALEERIRRADQAVEREASQARQQELQTALSVGSTLLGAFMGRKALSQSTLGRASTAARSAGRSAKERQDIGRAKDSREALKQQLEDLEAEFQAATQALQSKIDPLAENLEPVSIKPKKADIGVQLVALLWAPHWQDPSGGMTPAW
jgi:hypothetical protein